MAAPLATKKTDEEMHPENYFTSPTGPNGFKHIRDRIIINESSKIPKNGQFISLNGYGFLAKPGVEIDLPRPVRLMLDNLVETEITVGDDEVVYKRDIPRFTYRMVKEGVNLPDAVVPESGA